MLTYVTYDRDQVKRDLHSGKLIIPKKPPKPRIQFTCSVCDQTQDAFPNSYWARRNDSLIYPADMCAFCVNHWHPQRTGTGINGAYADHKVLRALRSITSALEWEIKNGKYNSLRTI